MFQKRVIAGFCAAWMFLLFSVVPAGAKASHSYSDADLRLMSGIIYAEAGGESFQGQVAVGIVVMNRKRSSSFPNTVNGVIYQPYQFGPVSNGSLNRALAMYDNGTLSRSCIRAAKLALNGKKTLTLNGKKVDFSSYYYFSGYVSGARLSIGHHQFK